MDFNNFMKIFLLRNILKMFAPTHSKIIESTAFQYLSNYITSFPRGELFAKPCNVSFIVTVYQLSFHHTFVDIDYRHFTVIKP